MARPVMLDVCSCAGLGADGYEAAGFEVVCLDNDPKALKHNPHETILGDAMVLLKDMGFLRQFAAVHASFPCQLFSATRELARAQGKGIGRAIDLLTPGLELLKKLDIPWIVENVERSPLKNMPGCVRLCASSWGLKAQRHRLFLPSPGINLVGSECNHSVFDRDPITGKPRPWGVCYKKGDEIPRGGRTVLTDEHGHECLGIRHRQVPWKFLCEGLPPEFTEYLGLQLIQQINGGSFMAKSHPVWVKEEAEGTVNAKNPDETTLDHGFRQLPYDFPTYVRLTRLMDDVRANPDDKEERVVRGLKGHVMEVDCFTVGVKVFIRLDTDGRLKVFAKDSEGTDVLGEWGVE